MAGAVLALSCSGSVRCCAGRGAARDGKIGHGMTAIIIQLLIGGVLLGGLYALIAFGLSLIYGVARVLTLRTGPCWRSPASPPA